MQLHLALSHLAWYCQNVIQIKEAHLLPPDYGHLQTLIVFLTKQPCPFLYFHAKENKLLRYTAPFLFLFQVYTIQHKLSRRHFFELEDNCLHYCISFFHTSTCISHRYLYIPSPWTLRPTSHLIPSLEVVTEHQVWVPCVIQQISVAYLLYMW